MMVIDTSAVTAIVFGEDDAESFLARILDERGELVIGAPTRIEAAIVIEARQGRAARDDLDALLDAVGASTVALEPHHVDLAVGAWRRFGKGRHPAGLNLGDCFAYALAIAEDAELLFKGHDFTQTDVRAAL